MVTTRDQIVFTNSVQSRSRNQPGNNVPIGGFSPNWSDGGLFFEMGTVIENIPAWSVYPWQRDRVLRQFWKTEPIMAGAVYSLTARLSALDFTLSGEAHLHDELYETLQSADYGDGLETLISKTINDVCTLDNGTFWELVGDGSPAGQLLGVAKGVNYLDPMQCYRTFDPEYPVLYIDPLRGSQHKLHVSRVVRMSNMPQPNELARGVGFSALSRALLSVQLMQSITRYRYEKSSGQFERAIGYGTGMTQVQLRGLLQQANYEDENSGFVRFGKIPFFVSPRKEVHLEILDLASIPDGFDLMNETEVYVMIVALAFGVDARELWAATQTGATKGDATIQHMKTKGKGLADLIRMIEKNINRYLMPKGVTFEFDFIDDEHDAEIAKTRQIKASTFTEIKNAGGLNDAQYQAHLIYEGVLQEEILQDADNMAVLPEEPIEEPIGDENPDNVIPFIDPDINPQEEMVKTLASYRRELRSIMRGVMDNQLTVPVGVQATDSVVRRSLTQAAYEGIEKAGLRRGDLTQDELIKIQNAIFKEQDYVVGLVEFAKQQGSLEQPGYNAVFNRVDMWANRYDMIVDTFYTMAAANNKTKWERHAKHETMDSCIDCTNYDGRVYRNSVWEKHDIHTQMWDLTCKGVHCGCGKVETDEPITRGYPPKPKGRAS